MKLYTYILIASLFPVFFLASCGQEEIKEGNQNSDVITLNVTVPGTASTRAVAPEGQESNITNLYILFYKVGGEVDALPDFIYAETGLTGAAWTKKFMFSSMNLDKDESYNVYTLANLPSTITPPTAGTKKSDLLALAETIGENQVRSSDGSDISFSSYNRGTPFLLSALVANTYNIELVRTVARLDMSIDTTDISNDWAIESVNIINEQLTTHYYKENTASTTNAARVGQANRRSAVDGKSCWRYYLYENSKELGENVTLKINLKSKVNPSETRQYTAIINSSNKGEINRNMIYKMAITLQESLIDVAWTVKDWIEDNMPTDIHGTYLTMNNTDIEVTSMFGGVLGIYTDAPIVHVDWSKASGFTLQGYSGVTEADVDVSDNTLDLHFLLEDISASPSPGIIDISAGNLTKKGISIVKKDVDLVYEFIEMRLDNGDGIYNEADDLVITSGSTLPGNLNVDANDFGIIYITMRRNSTWYYAVQSKIINTGMEIQNFSDQSVYNGTPGIYVQKILVQPNHVAFDSPMSLKIQLGVGYAGWGYLTHEFEFTMAEIN